LQHFHFIHLLHGIPHFSLVLPSGGASGPWPWLLELNRFPALGLRSASDEGTKLQVDGLPGVSLIHLNLLAKKVEI
jgi:hypothetical protein